VLKWCDALDGRNTAPPTVGDSGAQPPLPKEGACSSLVHAISLITTRVLSTSDGGEALIPIIDLLNHAEHPSATWTYDETLEAMQVTAAGPIAKGEEITISYGYWLKLSNSHLVSHYGFTVAPHLEPSQDVLLVAELGQAGALSLPVANVGRSHNLMELYLSTHGLSTEVMDLARDNHSGIERLRSYLLLYMQLYDDDKLLEPLHQTWKSNRAKYPHTMVWWAPLGGCVEAQKGGDDSEKVKEALKHCASQRDLTEELAAGSGWVKDVMRVKMSEYSCLVVYREILEIKAGLLSEQSALFSARGLAAHLQKDLGQRTDEKTKN